jgi:hypothetical protein
VKERDSNGNSIYFSENIKHVYNWTVEKCNTIMEENKKLIDYISIVSIQQKKTWASEINELYHFNFMIGVEQLKTVIPIFELLYERADKDCRLEIQTLIEKASLVKDSFLKLENQRN